ncbi:MAG TPA: PaaI family thioesterase [Ideonella sp.]|nr:PaaI family thioesterase [Ideonella sp.]
MAEAVTVSPEAFLQMGRDILVKQPFSVLLGAQLAALEPGKVELWLVLRPEHKQQNGFAHGGIVSYLADNALTFAGGTALRVPVVTAEYKLNYVRPATGERLVVRARAESVGRAQAVCRCEVYTVDGGTEKLCALGQGTIAKLGEPNGG